MAPPQRAASETLAATGNASDARGVLTDAVEREGWDLSYGLNFALLHLSTASAFLIAGVWRGHQELWERIYAIFKVRGRCRLVRRRAQGGSPDRPR